MGNQILKWNYEMSISINEFSNLPIIMSECNSSYYINDDTRHDILSQLDNCHGQFIKIGNNKLRYVCNSVSIMPCADDSIWKFVDTCSEFIGYIGKDVYKREWLIECVGIINNESIKLYLNFASGTYDLVKRAYRIEFQVFYLGQDGKLHDSFKDYLIEKE